MLFNYANAINETLVIRNIPSIYDDPNSLPYVENQKVFNYKRNHIFLILVLYLSG